MCYLEAGSYDATTGTEIIIGSSKRNNSYRLLLQVRKGYKKLMVDLAKLLGGGPNTEAMMMEIYDFEATLAKVSHASRF